jgi:hypothetical protein
MRVTVLVFSDAAQLARAFDRVLDSPEVASCLVEPEHVRIRFLSQPGAEKPLVDTIYAEGGLRWCTRHDVVDGGES